MSTCKYCNIEFPNLSGSVFSNHVRWCDKNPTSQETDNILNANRKSFDLRLGEKKEFTVYCHKCSSPITIVEREKQHPVKDRYFCNRSCANSRCFTEAAKKRVSTSLKNRETAPREERRCMGCNKSFFTLLSADKKYCSRECYKVDRCTNNEFMLYKEKCKFKFNVWQYPNEFELNLIKKYGWYQAANRGNNLGGISRDHRISVVYGWKNNVPSEIISHPANCKLMVHNDNVSKHSRCSLAVDELLKRVKDWNLKYV